jgi:magnesium transporter
VDDVIDVLVAESTEDVQKMGGVAPLDEPYFVAGFWDLIRKRAPWLVILFLGELLTATAMQHYELTFHTLFWLVVFIPLIISTGGNSGSQSATLVIRALATGELETRQILRVFLREFGMGVVLGILLGVIGLVRAILYPGNADPEPFKTALAVALTIVAVVLNGCVIGAILPIFLKKIRLDPALMSAPFIASLIDVTGIIIYFTIARLILGI